jgi:hypothetical protein
LGGGGGGYGGKGGFLQIFVAFIDTLIEVPTTFICNGNTVFVQFFIRKLIFCFLKF